MAVPKLLQNLLNTAKTSQAVVKKNTEKKAKTALGGLVKTQQETMPQARAKVLFPGLVKTAETTGAIGQANVSKQQAQAKQLLGGMTNTVKQSYIKSKDIALSDLTTQIAEGVQQGATVNIQKLKQAYPEIANADDNVLQELSDQIAEGTAQGKTINIDKLRAAYPELYQLPSIQPKSNVGSNISDVIGGAYRSVVDIPQSITESGILDNPAEYLAKGPVGEAIRSGAKSLFGEKALKEYQAKEGGKKFSEVAKGMTVGDPNSKLYQGSRVAGDVLQAGVGVAQVAKSLAKSGTKKAVLNMLKEADTVGGKRAALSRGGLDTQGSFSKFFKGSKDLVKPSKRTLEATDEVVNTIKGASKNPQKLYTQISTKISDIGSDLSSKLKTIGIKGSNLSTKELNTKLVELSNEIKDISPTMGKKLQVLSKNITNSADADEFRKSLQQLDDMIPENVKSGVNLSGKDQYIYDAWRAARGAGNDLLDNIANNIPDTAVKKSFKSMSNLYHAKGQISQNIGRLTPKVTGLGTKLVRAGKGLAGTVVAGKVLQELGVFD